MLDPDPVRPQPDAGPRVALALLVCAGMLGPASGRADPLSEVQRLNAELLGHDSATATLTAWCASHHLARLPRIVARRTAVAKPAGADVRALLAAAPREPIAFRHVELTCGHRVLSEADNWYRPRQLTPAMNAALATTDTPFGLVAKPLGYHRQTLQADVRVSLGARRVPGVVLVHRAVLETPDGTPFSYVVERYTRAVLAGG